MIDTKIEVGRLSFKSSQSIQVVEKNRIHQKLPGRYDPGGLDSWDPLMKGIVTEEFLFVVGFFLTLPETNSKQTHLKMDGWEYDPFLLGFGLSFRGELLVSGRVHLKNQNQIHKTSKRLHQFTRDSKHKNPHSQIKQFPKNSGIAQQQSSL